MARTLEIAAKWLTQTPRGGRDAAQLRLHVDGQTLTRLSDFDRKEERDYVRGSAVSLAMWFADNWWRLRYESLPNGAPPSTNWRLRHELTSASGGTLWPPIMVHSTGERVLFGRSFAKAVEIGPLRYILPEIVSISGSDFVVGIDQFFDLVTEECASATDGAALQQLVTILKRERDDDPNIHAWRKIEARLGYDPDTAPIAVMQEMNRLEVVVGESALDEAAAAAPGDKAANILAKVIEAASQSQIVVDLSAANLIDSIQIVGQPWQLGREVARRLRQATGLGTGAIRSRALSDLLKVTPDELKRPGTARNLPYSATMNVSNDRHRIALHSADVRDRRFELSCAIADQIWAQSSFGVISKAKTDRQKFQRAFAQNLLVPFSDLQDRFDGADLTESDIKIFAEHYHVNPNVIKRMLILERLLPEETFEDRLEAA